MTDVYFEFESAWIDKELNKRDGSALAHARTRMKSDPAYDERKYCAALFRAEATVNAFRGLGMR